MIHDLVDTVEGILLVDEGVKEDAQGPDILFLAAIGFSLEDFGGCVICSSGQSLVGIRRKEEEW